MTDGNLGLADIQHFTTRWNLLMYYNNTYKRSFCSVLPRSNSVGRNAYRINCNYLLQVPTCLAGQKAKTLIFT